MTKARDLANAADVLDDVSATELSYVNGVTSAIQTQLNAKQATVANVNDTEIGYLDGVTSAIQTQLDAKVAKSLVDAKGDLLVGSANDTVSRLAVSNDGETLVADSSQTTGLRYNPPVGSLANPIINGGFDIWQRGTSFASSGSAVVYTADRWSFLRGALATGGTVSRQTTSDTTNLPNIQYAARVQRDSGNTSTQTLQFATSLETANSLPFAGKAVTISFYARRGANYSAAGNAFNFYLYQGTGTDQAIYSTYTGISAVAQTSPSLTTTWTRYVVTGTVPSTATELAIYTDWTPVGTAGANDWVEITGVQIDVGTYTASSAPTFRRAGGTLAGELAACQRYYVRQGGQSLYQRLANGAFQSSTTAYIQFPHPVTMRVAPTSVDFSTMALNDYNSTIAATNITIDFAGGSMTSLAVTVASGGTQYRPVQLLTNNSTSAYVGLNAEL